MEILIKNVNDIGSVNDICYVNDIIIYIFIFYLVFKHSL